jgi:hypothetical protein
VSSGSAPAGISRVNTQAGASSLVSSQALSSVSHEMAKGQDPVRRVDNGSPVILKSI